MTIELSRALADLRELDDSLHERAPIARIRAAVRIAHGLLAPRANMREFVI